MWLALLFLFLVFPSSGSVYCNFRYCAMWNGQRHCWGTSCFQTYYVQRLVVAFITTSGGAVIVFFISIVEFVSSFVILKTIEVVPKALPTISMVWKVFSFLWSLWLEWPLRGFCVSDPACSLAYHLLKGFCIFVWWFHN